MKAKLPFIMSAAQKKAMNEEINRQILERDKTFSMDFDSTVLYVLHTTFGFGKKRLRRFWEAFIKDHDELRRYYEMDSEDNAWLCRRKLKEIGVDVEAWYEELDNK